MAQIDDLTAEMQEDDKLVDAVSAHVSDLDAQIAALNAQVAAGQPVDLTGLQAIADDMKAKLAAVAGPKPDATAQ